MKRDCGKGELIPDAWDLAYCSGPFDREFRCRYHDQAEAEKAFEAQRNNLARIPYSDVRLYVGDKEGYKNCILYWSQKSGIVIDRRSKLK